MNEPENERYGVNNHWWRNFQTTGEKEDHQLTIEEDPTATWEIFGFCHMSNTYQYTSLATADSIYVGETKTFTPLSAVFQKKALEEKAVRDKLAKEKAEADAV